MKQKPDISDSVSAVNTLKNAFKAFFDKTIAVFNIIKDFAVRIPHRAIAAVILLLFSMLICIITEVHLHHERYINVIGVTVDGIDMGYVRDKKRVQTLLSETEEYISLYTGKPYTSNADIEFSPASADSMEPFDSDGFREHLLASASVSAGSVYYSLRINDTDIGIYRSRDALNMLFSRIAFEQTGITDARIGFVDDITISPVWASENDLSDIKELETLLRSNVKETQFYTIKRGDTPSGIAFDLDISLSQLKYLNPDYDFDIIYAGDTITALASVPYITAAYTVREEYTDPAAFDTVTEYDDTLYYNESYTKRNGIDGEADIVADVVYSAGKVIKKTIRSLTYISEPTAQINIVGTKPLPPKEPTGIFIYPTVGILTSLTGYRPTFGDTHTGIDLANAEGSVVWASDGGTVIYAGDMGNYGNLVKIDHGNGYVTYYAHNSKILVEVGQKVSQHETIALMGDTGKATGPHCHFEIRYDGQWKNPLNYLTRK